MHELLIIITTAVTTVLVVGVLALFFHTEIIADIQKAHDAIVSARDKEIAAVKAARDDMQAKAIHLLEQLNAKDAATSSVVPPPENSEGPVAPTPTVLDAPASTGTPTVS